MPWTVEGRWSNLHVHGETRPNWLRMLRRPDHRQGRHLPPGGRTEL